MRIIAQSATASEHRNSSSAQATRSNWSSSLMGRPRLGRGGLAPGAGLLGVVFGERQPSHLLDELFERIAHGSNSIRNARLVSVRAPGANIDIYTPIANQLAIPIPAA